MQYIDKDWYGKPCPKAGFEIMKSRNWTFKVTVPTIATATPMAKPNQYHEGLWEQDVAEWFVVNPKTGRYVECNLAANGAWWMMLFSEPRKRTIIPSLAGVSSQYEQGDNSFKATLTIPDSLLLACLGETVWTHNVCFILGESPKQYLSLNRLNPKVPDFHRPDEIVIPLASSLNLKNDKKSRERVGKGKPSQWFVYMVRCADKSLYTGITTDVKRRVEEHNGEGGARYTRARNPVTLVYQEQVESRSMASKREFAIKQLKKKQKESLINV